MGNLIEIEQMSKAVGACLGIAAFIAAGVAVFGGKDDKGFGVINEEKEIKWDSEKYRGSAPPKPRFNVYDGEFCRSKVEEYFEAAYSTYELNLKNKEKMR